MLDEETLEYRVKKLEEKVGELEEIIKALVEDLYIKEINKTG